MVWMMRVGRRGRFLGLREREMVFSVGTSVSASLGQPGRGCLFLSRQWTTASRAEAATLSWGLTYPTAEKDFFAVAIVCLMANLYATTERF